MQSARRTIVLVVLILIGAAGCASTQPTTRPLSFSDDETRTYDALLTIPARRPPRGVGVLLIGGGAMTDQHWTVPPFVEQDGQVTRFTIDGQATRDADTIAAALARAGFVVLQWSSIHRDDEQHRKNPAMATPVQFGKSVDLSRRALRLLREQPEVNPECIALVGHSLGGARAWLIADEGVMGIVTLAGAYVSRVREGPSRLAAAAWQEAGDADADGDGALSRAEFAAWRPGAPSELPDYDHDSQSRPWELAASARLARLDAGDESALDTGPVWRDGFPWPIDRAEALGVPWLAIFGGLDAMSFHGPLIERWRTTGARPPTAPAPPAPPRASVSVVYYPTLGHQLAPQQGDLTGPIAPEVVERLVGWLREQAAAATAR